MSAALVTVAVDTTTQRVLLVLAAVLVGSSVGLAGALIFGFMSAARARPRPTAAEVRMSAPAILPLPPAPPPEADEPMASPFAGPGLGPVPALFAVDSDVARDRHRDLYDAEYAKQLDHVDALRRTIGTRLAVAGELHMPSMEEPDA